MNAHPSPFVARDVILVKAPLQGSPSGGRALLSHLIHDSSVETFSHRLEIQELQPRRLKGLQALACASLGHIDGLDDAAIESALRTFRHKDVRKVLIVGSNLGTLAAMMSKDESRPVFTYVVAAKSDLEIEDFLSSLGGVDIVVGTGGSGVEAFCRKPC